MQTAIIPTKYGYSAVVLPETVTEEGWNLEIPAVNIPPDLLVQLKSQITQDLADYCHSLSDWVGQFWVALIWAAWGITALAVSSMWKYGLQTALLYGWIRVLFFGDGVWALIGYLSHLRGLKRAAWLRKNLTKGEWVVKHTLGLPVHLHMCRNATETDTIEYAINWFPEAKRYYERMEEKRENWVMRYVPLGILGFFKRLMMGPKIVLPRMVYELGELECTDSAIPF